MEDDLLAVLIPTGDNQRPAPVGAIAEMPGIHGPGPSPAETDAMAWAVIDEASRRKRCVGARGLGAFLRDGAHAHITQKGDERTNIIDQGAKLTYNLGREHLRQLFVHLEACRLEGSITHFSERQGTAATPRSGLMLDFDIITTQRKPVLTDRHYYRIAGALVAALQRDVDFAPQLPPLAGGKRPSEAKIHVFFIVKAAAAPASTTAIATATASAAPGTAPTATTPLYKYGIHVLVPGVKMGRAYKKWLLRQFRAESGIMSVMQELGVVGDPAACLDQNSASVPVLYFGSCKFGGTPYVLGAALEVLVDVQCDINAGWVPPAVIKKLSAADLADYNLVAELGLLVEAEYEDGKDPLVRKMEFECRPAIAEKAQDWSDRSKGSCTPAGELMLAEHTLSTLTLHNAEARHLHALLDLLGEEYYTDRNKWRDVVFALANTSDQYKPLAIWFSHKCPRMWTDGGLAALDALWDDALARRASCDRPLSLPSIVYWARTSNPERYAEVMERSYFTMLTGFVYEHAGKLEHYMIAKVLHAMLGSKFCVDAEITGPRGAQSYYWFEFVVPGQSMKPGEVWKWRREVEPDDVHIYMSEKLTKVLDQISEHIEEKRTSATEEAQAKYYQQLGKAFVTTKRSLYNDTFKNGVIRQANYLFRRRGFIDKLDRIPDLFGTLNGVLKLGRRLTLIDHFHEHPISRFTTNAWKPFNPDDPWTRIVLNAIADIIVEADARDWILFHAAQGLSGNPKEGLMLLWEGGGQNGKSSFLRWVAKALGPYADKFVITLLTSEREAAEKPNSAMMKFKHLNYAYCEETSKSENLQESRMKEIVNPGEVSGRDLNSKQETFSMRCNFVVASQYSFVVSTTDHGTWRRLKHYRSKCKFRSKPDPNNPLEKKEDQRFMLEYPNDPQFLSSVLSVLGHYYERLQNEFGGELKNVPSPTIDRESVAFRLGQDALHRWICETIVISPSCETEYPLGVLGGHYTEWYNTHIDRKRHAAGSIIKDIEASALSGYLRPSPNRTLVLKGCRVLLGDELALRADEELFSDVALRGGRSSSEWADACAEADRLADTARRSDGRPWWEARTPTAMAAAATAMAAAATGGRKIIDDDDVDIDILADDEAVLRAGRPATAAPPKESAMSEAEIADLIENGFTLVSKSYVKPTLDDVYGAGAT